MEQHAARAIDSRWTARIFTAGTSLAALGLLGGILLQLLGGAPAGGNPLDAGEVLRAVIALRPWGWSMLGVIVLLLTPPAGLLATFVELRRADQPVSAWISLGVLGILAVAVLIALR